ncbi:SirB2 family protein [uncultured Acinetobacter sp.]|uniref:SirB2 family protein n=1 Tax=uncultured Acinetobacter sp. TaxID=165433 RepID=UPI00262F3787|nr:SirB2 family protein [uncultured Acinetobacter sp.]
MDTQLIIKIVHMSLASLLILVVFARAATLLVGVQGEQPNPVARKLLVGLQHFSVTFVVITGLVALYLKDFAVEPWFYAKVVLFFVMLSSLSKAFKQDNQLLLTQRRAGMMIAVLALLSLIGLVIIKPVF